MVRVVGVRFKKAGKIYYFEIGGLDLKEGDKVIVETVRGLEYGEVVIGPREVEEGYIVQPLKKVLRKATPADEKQVQENKLREKEAVGICQRKIQDHGLPMKLVDAEMTFDGAKIIFYFTAEGRVDFRELVKDLASVFRTRIELRQIGVRDEAKMLGGIGCCGRTLCCSSFMGEFDPVTIRMAKDQFLSLNPSKISGVCGRLMCCLRYENDIYEAAKEYFPPCGAQVRTPAGVGKVTAYNVIKETVIVEFAEGITSEFPLHQIEVEN
ncbi:MAG: hypothetical protein PWP65_101 [Clostridia bacterium]|nr:hypothetical protein [Clostridia bacterium]